MHIRSWILVFWCSGRREVAFRRGPQKGETKNRVLETSARRSRSHGHAGGAHHLQGGRGVAGSVVRLQYWAYGLFFVQNLAKYSVRTVEKVNRSTKKLNRGPADGFGRRTHFETVCSDSRLSAEVPGVFGCSLDEFLTVFLPKYLQKRCSDY